MPSDDFHFDIIGAPLDLSMQVAALAAKEAKGWRIEEAGPNGRPRLILYWAESTEATPLPAPLGGEGLIEFVKSWLRTANYGREPDIDGSTGRGWRVYNEAWGHINREWEAYVAIEPYWLEYGK